MYLQDTTRPFYEYTPWVRDRNVINSQEHGDNVQDALNETLVINGDNETLVINGDSANCTPHTPRSRIHAPNSMLQTGTSKRWRRRRSSFGVTALSTFRLSTTYVL